MYLDGVGFAAQRSAPSAASQVPSKNFLCLATLESRLDAHQYGDGTRGRAVRAPRAWGAKEILRARTLSFQGSRGHIRFEGQSKALHFSKAFRLCAKTASLLPKLSFCNARACSMQSF